jgi:hypothetical protein
MVCDTLTNNTNSSTSSLASNMEFVEFELSITYTVHVVLAITIASNKRCGSESNIYYGLSYNFVYS